MDFPVEENHKLALVTSNDLDDPTSDRSLVGRLIYLTTMCPELSYPVHIPSQFMQNPKEAHTDATR